MPLSRRDFLKGLGIAVVGTGMSSVAYDRLIPYLNQPEDLIPGESTWYATSCRECPAGCSMIVRNCDSRVVKCEGNPLSPINRGRLCSRGQAALHGLYDPDRVKGPSHCDRRGHLVGSSWDAALRAISDQLAKARSVVMITDLQAGSLESLMRAWAGAFGGGLVVYEPLNYESVKAVNGGVVPRYNLAAGDYILSFGADFLETWVSPVEYAADFSVMREVRNGSRGRFAYVGPRVSATAASADIRFLVPPNRMADVAHAILSGDTAGVRDLDLDLPEVARVSRGLASAKSPAILPGNGADPTRAAAILTARYGAGTSAERGRPHALTGTASGAEMDSLIANMDAGGVDAVIVYRANPAYALPESSGFRKALSKVPLVVSLSSHLDETTSLADWVLPSSTPLESWGDYTPYPGMSNLMQPTMGTLFDTRQTGDILMEIASGAGHDPVSTFKASSFYQYLRLRWGVPLAPGASPSDVSPEWESLVQRGGRWAGASGSASAVPAGASSPSNPTAGESAPPEKGILLWAFPHTHLYDGRGANRWWLQEVPEPTTKGVWGTWAELHPTTAKQLGVGLDQVVSIERGGVKIEVPAYVWEGVAPGVVAVPIGEGHTAYGRFAKGVGANVLSMLDSESPTVTVIPGWRHDWAARIKGSTDQAGREIVQTVGLGETFRREKPIRMPLPSGYGKDDFYPGHAYRKHRWAMTVDLDRCIGCQACVTACYAENNIPVIGRDEVYRKRTMEWLRIDRYIDWKDKSRPLQFQPMLCQHCDSAPCESVCPVFASAHNDEGLNTQIYNRCVGTRYCSNNCPYKVRRFEWYDPKWPEPLNYQLNPDVTVRCRGVMEKCTFCIQRIREVEMNALKEGRLVRDGEVVPACVQTCPTGVYTFGDLLDPESRVSGIIRDDPRAYQVLSELNTKTAVIYLKRIIDRG